jgi:drug/metabolite transporter (DMT)-like permease
MKNVLPILFLLFTMFAWGANFHLTKITLTYYSPMGVATWRFFLAIIGLLLILYSRFGKELFRFKFTSKEWWYLFLTAFFGVFLTIYFFNAGLETTSAINGSLIIATSPAITALLSFFMEKKRLKITQWFAIVLSFLGVLLILIKGDFYRLVQLQFEEGDIYILLMALVFSLSQIIISKHLTHLKPLLITTISSVFSLVFFLIFSIPELIAVHVPKDSEFWYSMLFMGLMGTALAYAAFYYSVVKVGATNATLYMNLIPFFAVILAFPFGERIYSIQLVGGLIIILGLLLFGISKRKKSVRVIPK